MVCVAQKYEREASDAWATRQGGQPAVDLNQTLSDACRSPRCGARAARGDRSEQPLAPCPRDCAAGCSVCAILMVMASHAVCRCCARPPLLLECGEWQGRCVQQRRQKAESAPYRPAHAHLLPAREAGLCLRAVCVPARLLPHLQRDALALLLFCCSLLHYFFCAAGSIAIAPQASQGRQPCTRATQERRRRLEEGETLPRLPTSTFAVHT